MADTIPVANPVGTAQILDGIDGYVSKMVALWEATKSPSDPWWKVWKTASVQNLQKATMFLLFVLDDLILFVDKELDSGPDKKATVLSVVSDLYDFIVAEALPIWMKPFSSQIKQYIVYCIVSSAIDFIVAKYRTGSWRDKIGVPKDTTTTAPATT